MPEIADTPEPPYYAVIFTSLLSADTEGYEEMAARMMALAAEQPGFLGVETAKEGVGITVSYWESLEAIHAWKGVAEHREAQRLGKERWYRAYHLRISKVERDYAGPR